MPYNEKSLVNLTPWPKGQSGNPAGGRLIDKDLEEFICAPEEKSGPSRKRLILERIFELAFNYPNACSLKACELLLNRVCGKEPITINHIVSKGPDMASEITIPSSEQNNTHES